MTIANKLNYIQAFHMGMANCQSCPLEYGDNCPEKAWGQWTREEIERAFNIISKSYKSYYDKE